jgi:histidine triad (HIT) family protein
MNEECRFCKIIKRESEGYIVFEDEDTIAFLDIRPLFPGHLLLLPKKHFETLADLPSILIEPLFKNAKFLSIIIEKGLPSDGSLIVINSHVSQSIPHLHVHIIPRNKGDGLKGFFWPRIPYKDKNSAIEMQMKLIDLIETYKSKGNF